MDGSGDPTAVTSDDGKWTDKDGNSDVQDRIGRHGGLVHLFRFHPLQLRMSALPRPRRVGSTYAPALIDSMKHLSYTDFYAVVASGKKDVSSSQELVMPANGENRNVMCYIDAIYVYLRARADDARRARPSAQARAEARCIYQGRGRMHGVMRRRGLVSTADADRALLARSELALIVSRASAQAPGLGARPNWSIPTRSVSAPTRTICRSPTRPARASRTSWPNCSPANSASPPATPIIRR